MLWRVAVNDLLSQHQYAAPGKKIQQASWLARDLYELSNKKKLDAFLIAFDFSKSLLTRSIKTFCRKHYPS